MTATADVSPTPADTEPKLAAERLRLMRHSVVNNLSVPITALVGIALVPIMLRALGQDNYSLWIVATSLSAILTASDLGLGWTVCRLVATDPMGCEDDHVAFVRSAGNISALMGLAAGCFLGLAGLLSGNRLHLMPLAQKAAPGVFWLVGASLLVERVSGFGSTVLAGLRRFELTNLVAAATSVVWGVAAFIVLANGGAVPAVAACLLGTSLVRCGITLALVVRLSPRYAFKPDLIRWQSVRNHVSFAFSSLMVELFSGLAWNCGPVLLGFIRGPAAAVPYYIAQKFPMAVSGMSWRSAEVLFPAASQNLDDAAKSRDILRVGSRWVPALALPFAVLLMVTAPHLLQAWIGSIPAGADSILRILAVVVVVDAVASGPFLVLWGRGAIKTILATQVGLGIGVVSLTLIGTALLGATGAALGLLVPLGAAAVLFIAAASRLCAIRPLRLLADAWRGLALPAAICAASAALLLWSGGHGRLWVMTVLAVSGLAYLIVLFGVSGNADEKRFARDVLTRFFGPFRKRST
jgi:O-antigen/teichoic acid export membrane protein